MDEGHKKIKKVLLLGSGALKIGQAGEFDYSGSQAIKALKEEGVEVVLVNPNIATIQTSPGFADKVYFLPIEPYFVQKIIESEKPQGILLSFGGQTALNCGLELEKAKIFKKTRVQILGTPIEAIEKTEDRHSFAQTLKNINLLIPKSVAATTPQKAASAAQKIGYPAMIRGAFSLGGQDSGVVRNQKQLIHLATQALAKSPQILVEEYLAGWKEVEYEVVRDQYDNCITVCNMENVDPMGIHTGESIVVAPSQTLNNFEYHKLRSIAIQVVRHLKIVGECNIQFALNPKPEKISNSQKGRQDTNQKHGEASSIINNVYQKKYAAGGDLSETKINHRNFTTDGRAIFDGIEVDQQLDYRIIEVNARLSRSSALASKATGYPLAYIAAKLALGYALTDLQNSVTKKTIACFEPALDYLVVKIPRWDFAKFQKSNVEIGTSMQSVGEVMAVGRKFEEVIQKAIRMLDIGFESPLDEKAPQISWQKPTPWRLFAITQALAKNVSLQKISQNTGIDPFFLYKLKNIVDLEKGLAKNKVSKLSKETLLYVKQLGTSDKRIAQLTKTTSQKIKNLRARFKIHPAAKQIDTLAAEYPAQTNYLYLTYNGESDDIDPKSNVQSQMSKVIVLGSGPYRIGSSVEFDWCSVTCAQTASQLGTEPIIINCNPETVSTDYDMAEKLYFEELTEETITEIYQKEKPIGIIVSMGGQTPNNLAPKLLKANLKILGTTVSSIDRAEDRSKFSRLCDQLQINQPVWDKFKTPRSAIEFAEKIGYPVLVRPSYVLSGAAMNVAFNSQDLKDYLQVASKVSTEYPVVISKFHQDAKEVEIDAVAQDGQILVHAICEHVENAGVHSGDSFMVLPPQKLYTQTIDQIKQIATQVAKNLKITGPFNIQFLAQNNQVMVIECNLRASRSLPFVSKVTGINFVKVATQAILNEGSYLKNMTKRALKFHPNSHSHVASAGLSEAVASSSNLTREPAERFLRERTEQLNPAGPVNHQYVAVKAPQFSFGRIKGADPILRVEMASTGEVACFGNDVYEAFLKAIISTGVSLPKRSVFISLAGDENKAKFKESAKLLQKSGLKIYATAGTAKFLNSHGITAIMLHKIHERRKPNVLDFLKTKKIDLVINIFDPYFKKEFDDDYLIRRATIDFGIPLLANLQTAQLFTKAIATKKLKDLKILPWNHYVQF